ncbi:MAG: hypothetical protein ACE5GV_07450 [Candidatus Scalindua sp.]
MQNGIKVNNILQEVSHLTLEEQDFIVNTVSKRIHEVRREKIAERGKEAENNLSNGNVITDTADDLMKRVDDD